MNKFLKYFFVYIESLLSTLIGVGLGFLVVLVIASFSLWDGYRPLPDLVFAFLYLIPIAGGLLMSIFSCKRSKRINNLSNYIWFVWFFGATTSTLLLYLIFGGVFIHSSPPHPDSAIRANLNNIRALAELYYDNNNSSYDGVCNDTNVSIALRAADKAYKNSYGECKDTNDSPLASKEYWVVWHTLKPDTKKENYFFKEETQRYYCVDSIGIATTTYQKPETSLGMCPPGEDL